MNPIWIDRLGNWNPQFLRECRGRLKTRTLIVAIAGSAILQILVLMGFNQIQTFSNQTSQENWLNLFRSLTWVLPYFLFLSGSYMLISDVTLEERRGTLNFIRLTPRASQSILLGKMMGVPILPYLSIILLMPLHLMAAIGGGVPIGFILSYYLILGVSAFFWFSLSLLVASLGNTQTLAGSQQSTAAISFTGMTFLFFTPLFMTWNSYTTWSAFNVLNPNTDRQYFNLTWLYMDISSNFLLSHLFVLANLAIATFGIWQVLRRRFYSPNSTILSKSQSYALVAYIQILMFGFAVSRPQVPLFLLKVDIINFGLGLLLIAAITPKRQAVLDWLRFERIDRRQLEDWIWSEKSPAPLAIAINLIIISLIWVPWGLLSSGNRINLPLSQFFTLMIYALIVQLILLKQIQRPAVWAIGTIATLLFLPPVFLLLLTITPDKAPVIWAFFGYSWTNFANTGRSAPIIISLLGQFGVMVLLGNALKGQLNSLRAIPKAA